MHNIKDLKIWNEAIELAIRIYDVSGKFPADERFGLISQIRRCAISVPSNISEGAGRNSMGEFKQFLGIANGSCYELQTQIVIAQKLEFINNEDCSDILNRIDELQKMNYKLQSVLTPK